MSARIKNNTEQGNLINISAKLHWVIYKWSIIWFVIALIFFLSGSHGAGVLLTLLALALFFINFLKYKNSYFIIDEHKFILHKGVISRHISDLPFKQFEAVKVYQGAVGRALNYGTLTITGTGGVRLVLEPIENPIGYKNIVNRATHSVQ